MTDLNLEIVEALPPVVLYHAGCADGFCAAWVWYNEYPESEFIPVQYHQPVPESVMQGNRDVVILDFSYSRDTLLELHEISKSVLVLDHHPTAEAALEGLHFCHFGHGKSGARMTWEHLYGNLESPWLVDYTEDRDLWTWKLPESRAVNAVIGTVPFEFESWDGLFELLGDVDPETYQMQLQYISALGNAILQAQDIVVKTMVSKATEIELAGHKVLCVNSTFYTSEVAGKLAEGRPFGVCWFETGDGKRVYSLRSRDSAVDVSEIAKSFGGGGHHNAAGFTVTAHPPDYYLKFGSVIKDT